MPDEITPADPSNRRRRAELLERAMKLLLEEYSSFVLIARYTDENNSSGFDVHRNGQFSEMRGLVEMLRTRLDDEDRRFIEQSRRLDDEEGYKP
jgi:hypothetical protein